MEKQLVIHCVGFEGLTITVSGVDLSKPMTPDVLRVTTLLGSIESTVRELPVTYDTADFDRNLAIFDSSGKAIYQWRLHAAAQPSVAGHRQPQSQLAENLERHRRSPSISTPPPYWTAETPLNPRSSKALDEIYDPRHASSDAQPMAEELDRPRRLRSGNARKVNYHESSLIQSDHDNTSDSTSTPSVPRPKRQSKRKFSKKLNRKGGSSPEPLGSDMPSATKHGYTTRPTFTPTVDSGLDPSESDVAPRKGPRSKRRKRIRTEGFSDRESESPLLDMTQIRKGYLCYLLHRLLRENAKDSKPFAKPVDAAAEGIPTYHTVIERAMDLRTLKENLRKGFYSTVEDFEADFNLMIENSIRFNGLAHEVSRGGLRLLDTFNGLMASLPGRD